MTANQIKYAEHLEGVRHNLATEGETKRSNLQSESIGRAQAAASQSQAYAAQMNANTNYLNAQTRQKEYELAEKKWNEENVTSYITGTTGASNVLRTGVSLLKWALN